MGRIACIGILDNGVLDTMIDDTWTSIEDKIPDKGKLLWYYFEPVGAWKGYFEGYFVDEDGKEWEGLHVFVEENNRGFLTGDVTHWKYA